MSINPRDLQKMMKKMKMQELKGVVEVVIKFEDYELVIPNAEVTRMEMNGEVHQVSGRAERRNRSDVEVIEVEISDEDVALVATQTGATEEAAEEALLVTEGDIAQAIKRIKAG